MRFNRRTRRNAAPGGLRLAVLLWLLLIVLHLAAVLLFALPSPLWAYLAGSLHQVVQGGDGGMLVIALGFAAIALLLAWMLWRGSRLAAIALLLVALAEFAGQVRSLMTSLGSGEALGLGRELAVAGAALQLILSGLMLFLLVARARHRRGFR